jgi:hypothetical protein
MSALPPKADMAAGKVDVRFVPQAHIRGVVGGIHGGAVPCIEGSSHMGRIQTASCGRPTVRLPKPRFAATSRATARVKCAMVGAPYISGSTTWSSNTSAIRWARATSCAKTSRRTLACGNRGSWRSRSSTPQVNAPWEPPPEEQGR